MLRNFSFASFLGLFCFIFFLFFIFFFFLLFFQHYICQISFLFFETESLYVVLAV